MITKHFFRRSKFERRSARSGILFILPWLIGFIFFFLKPFISAIGFSFSKVIFPEQGGIDLEFIGLKNYTDALFNDPDFIRDLIESLGTNLSNIIIILFFSFLIAILLNSKFRGRTLARAIFFLPVIIASGPVLNLLTGDQMASMMLSGQRNSILFEASALQDMLLNMRLPQTLIDSLMGVVNGIFNLSWQSGVQILLFLAGLQNIPRQLYEAADVEGATAWEKLWRLTFPMLKSVFLLNIVYTTINEFASMSNKTMQLIMTYLSGLKMGESSARALIYFIIVFAALGIVFLISGRRSRREG